MGEAFGCSYLYLTAIDAVRSTTKSALLPNPDFPDVRPGQESDLSSRCKRLILSIPGHQSSDLQLECRRGALLPHEIVRLTHRTPSRQQSSNHQQAPDPVGGENGRSFPARRHSLV